MASELRSADAQLHPLQGMDRLPSMPEYYLFTFREVDTFSHFLGHVKAFKRNCGE